MQDFDRDPTLNELLAPAQQQTLLTLLGQLSGADWQLHQHSAAERVSVSYQLDELAWIEAGLSPPQVKAGAQLLEVILSYVAKYRLAASLHLDVTEASYVELQKQNAALLASEQRYRGLADSLQQQVDAQVASLRAAEHALHDAARLRAVGQLAAGVAHEINNPLGFINSNLQVAGEYLDDMVAAIPHDKQDAAMLDDFRQLLAESAEGAQRIASIVTDLKTFANLNQQDCQPCDLNAVLDNALRMLAGVHGRLPEVAFTRATLPPLIAYPARLSQALFNLLDNALKAMPVDGRLALATAINDDIQSVVVTDQGCGMTAEQLARACEPFYTTRSVGAGAGLGLSVAYETALAHGGDLTLQSAPQQGTRVVMTLRSVQP